ncbi:angiopoietin-1 [Procambarus clarkii]|uniref:angiopoietin-1 n=1 Tax=Procambarus clarkii TaxID=6728 RepID=UPI003742F213
MFSVVVAAALVGCRLADTHSPLYHAPPNTSHHETSPMYSNTSYHETSPMYSNTSYHETPPMYSNTSYHETSPMYSNTSYHETSPMYSNTSYHETSPMYSNTSYHETSPLFSPTTHNEKSTNTFTKFRNSSKNIERRDKVKRNTDNCASPGTAVSEDLLQAFFLAQLENNKMLRSLSRAFSVHQKQHIQATQDVTHENNVTQHLMREIEVLNQKIFQQKADAQQNAELLLLKKVTLLEREESLKEVSDQLEENIVLLQNQTQLIRDLQEDKKLLQNEMDILEQELAECQGNKTETTTQSPKSPARDCEDLAHQGVTESGVYQIFPETWPKGMTVYCKQEDGSLWTVFLNRRRQTPQENFSRPWQDYKVGFGDQYGEHWLGNDNLHILTSGELHYRLRVDATNLRGQQRSGEWETFSVGNEASRYRATLRGYVSSSTLGDALTGPADASMDGMSFSTLDRDHDTWPHNSCAADWHAGGGWWYRGCSRASPTSPLGTRDGVRTIMCLGYFSPGVEERVGLSKLIMMLRRITNKS